MTNYKYLDIKDVDYHNREHNYECNFEFGSWDGTLYTCHTHELSTTAERFNNFDYFVAGKKSGEILGGFPSWAAAYDYILDNTQGDELSMSGYEILDRDGEPVVA